MAKQFFVYIIASKKNGTLYVGVTSTLAQRIWQRKNKLVEGFTAKHQIDKLVYYEAHENVENAFFVKSKSRNGIEPGRYSSSKR